MKTILLPIHDDDGAEARFQVALDLARAHGAHLNCLQVTPLTAYVASDSFGGVFEEDAEHGEGPVIADVDHVHLDRVSFTINGVFGRRVKVNRVQRVHLISIVLIHETAAESASDRGTGVGIRRVAVVIWRAVFLLHRQHQREGGRRSHEVADGSDVLRGRRRW